ncbi:DUF2252 domain-containing protein [Epidermidibacterium keratini]|uniref:DUF2252 domain-containing protein n=1 Tax=Epidermidibacterium keratini TaxID=1891644 RepID=A0A7L4YMZ0_9ACTN|nr:DUF2252 domain-containing protein [Epidermidibacterium keratini]QHC00422.1 DUF2252 domain-containing protein [Epidermidibacterium keratini]
MDTAVIAEARAQFRRTQPPYRTQAEQVASGTAARDRVPPAELAEVASYDGRPDPVELLAGQSSARIADLVPIRYERMAATPFTFFRGAALVMADDLSRTPNSGVNVWLCGDAHLSNFGLYASPERELAFDVNDFDEAYPGPFEWDVKRLAASIVVAGRQNGFTKKQCRRAVRATVKRYSAVMREQAGKGTLDVWYSGVKASDMVDAVGADLDTSSTRKTRKALKKARHRDNVQAWGKLTDDVDGVRRFVSEPPLIVPIRELLKPEDTARGFANVRSAFEEYRRTLSFAHRYLLDEYVLGDLARKVVGVGSVGMDAWIALMHGAAEDDPLILQLKQATESVLQRYLPGPAYSHHGQRVVDGQTLMQRTSDIFLGWQRGVGVDGTERDYYVRQLRDGKGSVVVEALTPDEMALYGEFCATALAYAHARGGDRYEVAAYLGDDDTFEKAIVAFAAEYAVRNREDHDKFTAAIADGELPADPNI